MLFNGCLNTIHHTLELLTLSFVCLQSLSVRKYFELEEHRQRDFLRRKELWVTEKKEAEELEKRTVSCGF